MTDGLETIRRLAIWSGPVEIAPLSGGLSNTNFVVRDAERRVVVRLGTDLPFHHVFRDRELASARAAHAAGLSPEVIHAEPGVVVTAFLGARPFTAEDVRAQWRRVLPLIRTAHQEMAEHVIGPPAFFWVFHVIRDYAATLRSAGHPIAPKIGDWLAQSRSFEAAQVPLPIVFGHHDLLPANILDDGDRLWFVDWEYGGFGTSMFDLANLAGNAGLSPEEEHELLASYFLRAVDTPLYRAYLAMKAASLLRESLWAFVSDLFMSIAGVDYAAYAAENLERYERARIAFEEAS